LRGAERENKPWKCKFRIEQDRKEIVPSTKDNIESFSQNASIGKSAKYRPIERLHRPPGIGLLIVD